MGSIALRKDNEFTFVDIEFADKDFHRTIILKDDLNISMGTMNYSGALLASKSLGFVNEDEYEENYDNEVLNSSSIQFKSFTYSYEACDWVLKLPEGENVETVAIGNDWCAVSTDYH